VHRGWAPDRDVALFRVRDAIGASVWPVHRLDRGTSGALVFGLNADIAADLSRIFAAGQIDKRYLALVRGVPPETCTIDHPLRTDDAPDSPRGPAQTELRRLRVFGRYSLVEARPLTGRLHQVRRHCKHIACPLLGDVRYGKGDHNRLFRERFGLQRLFLHAQSIAFAHPVTGAALRVEAPLPDELSACLAALQAATTLEAEAPSGEPP